MLFDVHAACASLRERTILETAALVSGLRESSALREDDAVFIDVVRTAVACGVRAREIAKRTGYYGEFIRCLLDPDGVVPDLSWARNHPDPARHDARLVILATIAGMLDEEAQNMKAAA